MAVVPHGNAYWLSLLIKNVAGSGDLSKVEVSGHRDGSYAMQAMHWHDHMQGIPAEIKCRPGWCSRI